MTPVSDVKLIRTDTTLDLSQKAEKGILHHCQPALLVPTLWNWAQKRMGLTPNSSFCFRRHANIPCALLDLRLCHGWREWTAEGQLDSLCWCRLEAPSCHGHHFKESASSCRRWKINLLNHKDRCPDYQAVMRSRMMVISQIDLIFVTEQYFHLLTPDIF